MLLLQAYTEHAACSMLSLRGYLITNDSNVALARLESSPFLAPKLRLSRKEFGMAGLVLWYLS